MDGDSTGDGTRNGGAGGDDAPAKPYNFSSMGLGIALGVGLGTSIGVATDNLSMWVGIGIASGAVFGAIVDALARRRRHGAK